MLNIAHFIFRYLRPNTRSIASNKIKDIVEEQHLAWQVHSYGEGVQKTTVRRPQIQGPNDLLIKVEAASVNPIDVYMADGYGQRIFNARRRWEMDLPLILGRDFCGKILNKGHGVEDSFQVGDEVYGFVPVHLQGSFAETIIADKSQICKKPKNLSAVESTSLVYASMTAWGALYVTANLATKKKVEGTKVLILGASGGVGTVAVQLLKSQGCQVFATSSADAIELVKSLGADKVFDYRDPDYLQKLSEVHYDIILDCAKFGYSNIPPTWKYDTFVTLNSPLMLNTDKYGLIGGSLLSMGSLLMTNLSEMFKKRCIKWGFFVPSKSGFEFINELICEGKMRPLIHKVFDFNELPEAFEEIKKGHLRGKVVVKF